MRLTGITIGVGLTLLGTAIAFHTIRASAPSVPKVTLLRTPNQGIQPQTVLDANGVLHMIYFKGDVSAGDIEYVRTDPSGRSFSEPIRVNSEPGSAVAIGTVRGPQLSVGRNARAYVIWFGPQAKSGDPTATMPVFFSRLNDSGTAFEPQRNLMQYAKGGDGGISVAADVRGNVHAVWHAAGEEPGDEHRRVYLARSTDEGKNYARVRGRTRRSLRSLSFCGTKYPSRHHASCFDGPRQYVSHRGCCFMGAERLSNEYRLSERRWAASASRVGEGGRS